MTVQITLLEFTTTRYITATIGYIQYFKLKQTQPNDKIRKFIL